MKNIWRTYIQPLDDDGEYSGEWIEVTDDTDLASLGALAIQTDNTTYDTGIFRNSSLAIKLNNVLGRYSDVGQTNSIFHYTRNGSLFKLTWSVDDNDGPLAGIAIAGESYLSDESDIFTGIISDEATTLDIKSQLLSLTVLGRESLLSKIKVPDSALPVLGIHSSLFIYTVLNQPLITDLLTVSAPNIVCDLEVFIDNVAPFSNLSGFEAISKVLVASNSILYIEDDTIYVSSRDEGDTLDYTFYAQSSRIGAENIVDITKVRTGLNRMVNSFIWSTTDTDILAEDEDSINKYGVVQSSVSYDFITDEDQMGLILQRLLEGVKLPKQEFEIATPMNSDTLNIGLLSKVAIDYPVVYYKSDIPYPICGLAVCGHAVLPKGYWAFSLLPTEYYKVISSKLDIKKSVINFNLRAL